MTNPDAARAVLPADFLAVRSDLELLDISGPDAATFLQGQCTADVEKLPVGRWTWAGYCTPKGRLLATFRVGRRETGYLLQLPAGTSTTLAARLRKFVMRSKVTLAPIDTWPAVLQVAGVAARAQATDGLGIGTLGPGDFSAIDGAVVFGTAEGLVAHLTADRAAAVITAIRAENVSPLAAVLADIRAGLPWILPAVEDAFVPQMVSLDRIDGVSFTKGCYPGQEIVARTRYLGTVKRHLYHLVLGGPAAVGDPIMAADQQVGTLLAAVEMPGHAAEALAVIDGASVASGNLATAAGAVGSTQRVHPDADA